MRSRMHRVIGALLLLLVVAGTPVVAAAPATSAPAPTGIPVPPALVPGGPSVALADLPPEDVTPFTGVALVEVGGGCSGVLVAPRDGPIPPGAPAYVLTNGHCIDFLPPAAISRDLAPTGTVTFGWEGSPVDDVVAVRAIPWAAMKGTDLAILELDTPLLGLVTQGIRAVPIAPSPVPAGTPIVIVGGPTPVDGEERRLVAATCALGETHALVEDDWSWSGFRSNDCADIRPGSSGSPVLDATTGQLAGLINTGTAGSEDRSDCMIDRPCEVGPGARAVSMADGVYGPDVSGLGACFDAGWVFTGPGGACPLDPGFGVEVSQWTTVTNPDVTPPTARTPRTAWDAVLVATDPSVTHHRSKTGPLGVVDCHDPAGYGPPVALAEVPIIEDPLPTAEGRYQLCLLGGTGPTDADRWQEPSFATIATAWVDRTPPLPTVQLRIQTRSDRWEVEPMLTPPELQVFRWKTGPAATTACADPGGYTVYRHAPRKLLFADAPVRVCVIGHDEAGNPTPPLDRVLPRDPAQAA